MVSLSRIPYLPRDDIILSQLNTVISGNFIHNITRGKYHRISIDKPWETREYVFQGPSNMIVSVNEHELVTMHQVDDSTEVILNYKVTSNPVLVPYRKRSVRIPYSIDDSDIERIDGNLYHKSISPDNVMILYSFYDAKEVTRIQIPQGYRYMRATKGHTILMEPNSHQCYVLYPDGTMRSTLIEYNNSWDISLINDRLVLLDEDTLSIEGIDKVSIPPNDGTLILDGNIILLKHKRMKGYHEILYSIDLGARRGMKRRLDP